MKPMVSALKCVASQLTTDIIAVRMMYGSSNPTDLIMITIIATIVNTTLALLVDRILWKRDKYHEYH